MTAQALSGSAPPGLCYVTYVSRDLIKLAGANRQWRHHLRAAGLDVSWWPGKRAGQKCEMTDDSKISRHGRRTGRRWYPKGRLYFARPLGIVDRAGGQRHRQPWWLQAVSGQPDVRIGLLYL